MRPPHDEEKLALIVCARSIALRPSRGSIWECDRASSDRGANVRLGEGVHSEAE